MLKIKAILPEEINFRQIQNKGKRYRWIDKSTDKLVILSEHPTPDPKEWDVLFRIEQGETRVGVKYPRRLELVCLPPTIGTPLATIVRERWKGNFAFSWEPTLRFFVFPVEGDSQNNWLMISVVAKV